MIDLFVSWLLCVIVICLRRMNVTFADVIQSFNHEQGENIEWLEKHPYMLLFVLIPGFALVILYNCWG